MLPHHTQRYFLPDRNQDIAAEKSLFFRYQRVLFLREQIQNLFHHDHMLPVIAKIKDIFKRGTFFQGKIRQAGPGRIMRFFPHKDEPVFKHGWMGVFFCQGKSVSGPAPGPGEIERVKMRLKPVKGFEDGLVQNLQRLTAQYFYPSPGFLIVSQRHLENV